MGMSNEQGQQFQTGEISGEPTGMHLQSNALTFVTEIKEHDVLLGRGKSNATHIGNVLFQGKCSIDL
jgi:hypothetical protein